MDKYEQTAETWNGMAKIYEEKFMYLNLYDKSYDLFIQLIHKEDAAILEFGCGPGNICHYMLQQQPGWKWLGTDVAPAMVELAKENNPAAVFELMDARDADKISQPFNGIVSGFCLPFLSQEDCAVFFKNAAHILSPGGVLYLSFMEGPYENSRYKTGSNGLQTYFHYHPMPVIEAQLAAAGLHIEKIMQVEYQREGSGGEMHTIVIATNNRKGTVKNKE